MLAFVIKVAVPEHFAAELAEQFALVRSFAVGGQFDDKTAMERFSI
jgi:hypothetical protein